jgi:hypothetical protein
MAAIRARPGVVSSAPAAVTIGGHEGRVLDLHIADSWAGSCRTPDGPVVGVPLLVEAGSAKSPLVGIGRDQPVRLILVDLGAERSMAIVIFDIGPTRPSLFEADVAAAMPIVESFEFHSPAP